MKLKLIPLFLLTISLSFYASASDDKYLGKSTKKDESASTVTNKKPVNLLAEDILIKNPHYANASFWEETDSTKVIDIESIKKELSEEIFNMVKEVANAPVLSIEPDGVNAAKRSKTFVPPKTALIGNDHHHNFAVIEEKYSEQYNPNVFYGKGITKDIVYSIEHKKWVIDELGKTSLSNELTISSKKPISYFDFADNVVFDISSYFFDSISGLKESDIKITRINDNKDELISGKFDFVLRDMCVLNAASQEVILVRMKINSAEQNIASADVFPGLNCE